MFNIQDQTCPRVAIPGCFLNQSKLYNDWVLLVLYKLQISQSGMLGAPWVFGPKTIDRVASAFQPLVQFTVLEIRVKTLADNNLFA